MQEHVPPGSLVLIELDSSLYDEVVKQQIAEYIKAQCKSFVIVVRGHELSTTVNILTPRGY